jgi:hypothetical protein
MPRAQKAKNDQGSEGNRAQNGFFEAGSKIKSSKSGDGAPALGVVAHSVQEHRGYLVKWAMDDEVTHSPPPNAANAVRKLRERAKSFLSEAPPRHVSKADDS